MKKNLLKIGLAAILVFAFGNLAQAQQFGDNLGNHTATQNLNMSSKNIVSAATVSATGVVIGTTALANANVALQVDGTDKAILVPRVTSTGAVSTPLDGMIVYSTASGDIGFRVYQAGAWVALGSSSITAGTLGADNANGFTLTLSGQNTVLALSAANGASPGVINGLAQTFAGDKTFGGNVIVNGTNTLTVGTGATTLGGALGVTGATTLYGNTAISGASTLTVGTGATTLGGTLTAPAIGNALDDGTEKSVVINSAGLILKSSASAVSFAKTAVAITGTTTTLTSGNSISFDLTVSGVQTDDGIVVNPVAADKDAFKGLIIISAIATATNTVTVTIADLRNSATIGYAPAALDGKKLVVSRVR